ncbi:phosphatidylglycerol lysyltransferase domain-containing protein [bacterium]|nr:phosphatidylglycerol lysyltransferase domain-containing protein [bacterium]
MPESEFEQTERLLKVEYLARSASDAHALMSLIGDKRFFFNGSYTAFLMYDLKGSDAVVLGPPVGKTEEWMPLLHSFLKICETRNFHPVFLNVESSIADYLPESHSYNLLKIGEDAIISLDEFNIESPENRRLRRSHRRGNNDGLLFQVISAENVLQLFPVLQQISSNWVNDSPLGEMGFTLGRFEVEYMQHFPIAVVCTTNDSPHPLLQGQPLMFASILTTAGRESITLDVFRRTLDVTNETGDFFFVSAIDWAKIQGYNSFHLGLAPLADISNSDNSPAQPKIWSLFTANIFSNSTRYYNFQGIQTHKQKFHPNWNPKYLVSRGGIHSIHAVWNTLRLILRR